MPDQAPNRVASHGEQSLRLPTSQAFQSLFTGIMAATRHPTAHGWVLKGCGAEHGCGPKRLVLVAPSKPDAAAALAAISPLTLDTLILTLDGLAHHREGFLFPLSSVLSAKGSARSGAERQALIAQVAAEVALLSRLALLSAGAPQPVFSIELTEVNNLGRTWEQAAIIEPGPALKGRLNDPAWVGIPGAVVALDHRAVRGPDVLAKKLAVALHLKPEVTSVADLLKRIGESVDISVEPRGGRVADRFDAAIERLRAATGISLRRSPVHERQKGWLKEWLDTPLELTIDPGVHCCGER